MFSVSAGPGQVKRDDRWTTWQAEHAGTNRFPTIASTIGPVGLASARRPGAASRGEALVSLLDRLFPPDEHPGVGIFGRMFLAATDAKPQRGAWFGPASSWTQRKAKPTPDGAYAPPIVRHHQAWPHESWPVAAPRVASAPISRGRG